jgi:hypothetical protein
MQCVLRRLVFPLPVMFRGGLLKPRGSWDVFRIFMNMFGCAQYCHSVRPEELDAHISTSLASDPSGRTPHRMYCTRVEMTTIESLSGMPLTWGL